MAETGPLARQPTKLDYASPTQFRFGIHQLPKVEFFTIACNLPGINMGDAIFPTPFKDIPIMGDRITYENLSITFIVDEYLENYRSIHEWMTAIGFPKDRKQFSDFRSNTSNTPEALAAVASADFGDVKKATSASALFSDANLIVLSNKNNAILEIMFRNMYPVALGALQYTQDATDVQYLTATADFTYQIYEFSDIIS
tara:strand:- start:490 stop:1086 length:597 start_codon:yes stop_codon:yes gene_type:complete